MKETKYEEEEEEVLVQVMRVVTYIDDLVFVTWGLLASILGFQNHQSHWLVSLAESTDFLLSIGGLVGSWAGRFLPLGIFHDFSGV